MFSVLITKEGIIIPMIFITFVLSLGLYLILMHRLFSNPNKNKRIENQKLIDGVNKSFSQSFKAKDF